MHDHTARNIGLALALAGLLLNPWFIGLAFLPRGRVETAAAVQVILLADLCCTAVGVWFFLRRRSLDRRSAWFSLAILVIIPLGIEAGLQVLRVAQNRFLAQSLDNRLPWSCFRSRPWAPDLVREQHALVVSFEQFLGWRTEEYHGRYVNVEANGIRRTVNSPPGDQASDVRMYMFGGSAMWGTYARDSCTLPSLVALRWLRTGSPIQVFNFGQPGFNFTQGVIQLTLLLRAGERPDIAVFYEGFNDIGAARAFGRAGETSLSSEFTDLIDVRRSGFLKQAGLAAGEAISRESMLYRSVSRGMQFIAGPPSPVEGMPDLTDAAIDSLSRSIAREYRLSYALLDSLSHLYGFKYVCVLQPGLFTKAAISHEEETVDPAQHDPELRSLFLLTYARLREEHFPHFYDCTRLFDGHRETVYIDVCHVSEEGNAVLADTLLHIVRQER